MQEKTNIQTKSQNIISSSRAEGNMPVNTEEVMSFCDSILSGALVETREAGYSFTPHLHRNMEIYHILSGECFMNIQSETLHCVEGDFVMVLPDIVHSFYLGEESGCTFQHVHFNPSMFQNIVLENKGVYPTTLMHAILFSSQLYYRMKTDDIMEQYIQRLIDLYKSADSLFSSANINVTLMNLMLYVLDHTGPSNQSEKTQLQNSYVAFALNYIHTNYTSKIKQEDIAQELHISVRYLSKLFKNYMGITLSNYINTYRVNRSIELMKDTDYTLTEIALLVGFKDSQHYSKVFMRMVNETPSHYKKSLVK